MGAGVALAAVLMSACSRPEARRAAVDEGVAALGRALSPDGSPDDLTRAAELLENAARLNPDSATAFGNLGIADWKLGRLDDAARAFKKAADLAPDDPRSLEFLSQVCVQEGDLEQARLALDRAFQRTSDTARILTAMGVASARAGGERLAQEFLTSALEQDERYLPALYNMAVLHRDFLKDNETAAVYFRRYVQAASSPGAVPDPLRLELAKDHSTPAASPSVPAKVASAPAPAPAPAEPDPAAISRILTDVRRAVKAEEVDRALILLKNAARTYPSDPMLTWELAALYECHLGDLEKAAGIYETFAETFGDDHRAGEARKRAALCRRNTERASSRSPVTLDGAVPDPDTALRLWSEGLRYHNAGDWDKAIERYRQAAQCDASLISAWYNLGLAYKAKEDLAAAADAFEHVLGLKPDMVEAEYMLGVIHRDARRPDEAIVHLGRALQMDPRHERAHFVIGLVYRDLKRHDEARLHFERTIELAPRSVYAEKARAFLNLPSHGQ
jgi:tetratricopeptide (TPR) repeat protein